MPTHRPGRGPGPFGTKGPFLLAGAALFGILIEVAQGLFFERTADAIDALMNLTGIALAWVVWRIVQRSASTT